MPHEDYQLERLRSIRRIILRAIGVQLYRYPVLPLLIVLALTVAAGWRATRLEVSANLRAFLPPAPEAHESWNAMRLIAPGTDPLLVLLRFRGEEPIDPAARRELVRILKQALDDPACFYSVRELNIRPRAKTGDATLLRLLRLEDVRRLAKLSSADGARDIIYRRMQGEHAGDAIDPEDPFDFFSGIADRGVTDSERWGVDPDANAIGLELRPVRGSSHLFYSVELRQFLRETIESLRQRAERGAAPESLLGRTDVSFVGRHLKTAELADRFRSELTRSFAIIVICVGLLLILAFRKIEALIFIGLPAAFGLIWTLGLLSYFLPGVSLLTAAFTGLLVALGVEYATQMYSRFIEELYRSERYYPALDTAYTEAGRGVFISAVTIALIFLSLRLSQFHNLQELALAGCLGVVCMAVATLVCLPPMAAIKSRLAGGKVEPTETYGFGMSRLSAGVASAPRTSLALGLAVTVYLGFFARDITVNREVGFDLGAKPAAAAEENGEDPPALAGYKKMSILVQSRTIEGALGRNDRLYANLRDMPEPFAARNIDTLSTRLPSRATQNAARLSLRRIDPADIRRALHSASLSLGLAANSFDPFVERLERLRGAAASQSFVSLKSTDEFAQVVKRIVRSGDGYRVETDYYPKHEVFKKDFEAFTRAAAMALDPESLRYDSEALRDWRVSQTVVYSMALTLLITGFSLLLCLLPHFHGRVGESLLAIAPIVVGIVWMFGLMQLLDKQANIYTLLVLPLIIGVGVDQSVLLIQRINERRYASVRQATRQGGRTGIVVSLVMMLALGTLAQMRFQALQDMATVALTGIAFITLATLILIPAFLEIRRQGGLSAWASEDEGQ